MAALSPAYRRFESRLDEVSHLRKLSQKYNTFSRIVGIERDAHVNILTRSSIVLLSSHIQGFIEDLGDLVVERIVLDSVSANRVPDSLRFHATKTKLKEIQQKTDGTAIVASIREYSNTYNDMISLSGPAPSTLIGSQYKDGFGNPTVKAITKYLMRFGFANYESEMKRRLKGNWPITENAVNQIVDRRNKIAHGDSLATLTPLEMREYIILVKRFCSTTDSVTTKHFRSIGCSL